MKLQYQGTGTISIEGFGEVGAGDVIGVSDELGRALIQERPEQFREAGHDAEPPVPQAKGPFAGPRMKNRGGD
jgi:hypothetical protein